MSANSAHHTTPSTTGTTAEDHMPQLLIVLNSTSDQDWNDLSCRAGSRAGKKPIPISDHVPVLPTHRKRNVTNLRASFGSHFRDDYIFRGAEFQEALELAKDVLSSRIEHYILTMFCIEDLADYKKGVSEIREEIGTILGKTPPCQEHEVLLGLLAPVLSKIAAMAEVPAPLDVSTPNTTISPAWINAATAPIAAVDPQSCPSPNMPSHSATSPQRQDTAQPSCHPVDEILRPRQED